jgi:hypothetical protein
MFPVLTRPRGSKKATRDSFDTALKDFKASLKDSELDLLMVGPAAARPDSLEAAVEVAATGLKRPVHSFGVVQAFGGGEASLTSSVCSVAASFNSVRSCWASAAGFSVCALSDVFAGAGLGIAFGRAGTTGTAGREGLGGTGVVSPAAGIDCWGIEEGVVGFVETVSSDTGWLVGVPGRGIIDSAVGSSAGICSVGIYCSSTSASASVSCEMIGSSTGAAESSAAGFRFLLVRLVGHGRSGLENQGSYDLLSDCNNKNGERSHTGVLNGSVDISSRGGDEGAILNDVVCGVGGVIGAGAACDECVEEGVCGGSGW